ncbi:sigma-70 family RNA polymerase sigma factor [Polyangium aurulentum]|uniref:sigma-70 family RNA polymerase sigma factor n=1 Tax=Polyangium aurulentum TaxID=2567896 RepID=UPI0010AEAAEC|nr:sigma-70 family RNA polymerase sigma factor [Polyangium aurulentum]UQA61358.1 sigma-70 family RNA polymerase sigma factor [Polyangium aurulentum]
MTTTIPKNIRQEFEKKIRGGIFNPVARFLPDEVREDRLQDAICQVWEMYARYAERGELLDDAILVHACRQRATDPSRYFVHCEGYKRKKDVLDPRNYMEGQVEVLHFGDVADDVEEAPVHLGFAELDTANPTKRIISAISLNEWLETLSPRDRELVELRAAGYDLDESAEKLGTSRFMVCRRIKELGESLAEHAGMLDCVYRRQWKRSAAGEEEAPESGVQVKKTRGRPIKSQAPTSITKDRPSRRVRRAA